MISAIREESHLILRYNEIKDYDYNRGGYQSGTGHFTQIIWKGTTKVGAAVVKRGNIVVVVARYTPAGNFMGRFKQNVLRQKPGGIIMLIINWQ